MPSRLLSVLMVVSLAIVVAGCEGETGPAGPSGDDGAGVLAWAEVDGFSPNAGINHRWPSSVSIDYTRIRQGEWTIELTGSFPSAEGVALAGVADGSGPIAMSTVITDWSSSAISIDVFAWNTTMDNNVDVQFTLVVFEQ